MKIVYLPKRRLNLGVIMLLAAAVLITGAIIYWREGNAASPTLEPVYQGSTGEKVVAMTVNVDWGEEFIPDMLKAFKQNNARVTFFVTGVWADKHPDLLKLMKKEGHSIQNHGYKHLHFNQLSREQIQEQIKKAEDIIFKATGTRSTFFASPYGEHEQGVVQAVAEMNYRFIMWSVDTIDWQKPSPETIEKRVTGRVHNDAIILMHPTEPTLKALPAMLANLKDQGYKMVTIDELLKTKGGNRTNNAARS